MTSTPRDMVGGMGPSDQVHGSAFDSHHGAPPEAWYPGAQRYPTAIQPFSEVSGADGSVMSELMEQYRPKPLQHLTPASVEEEWQQWPDAWDKTGGEKSNRKWRAKPPHADADDDADYDADDDTDDDVDDDADDLCSTSDLRMGGAGTEKSRKTDTRKAGSKRN
ncbi:uncharacterized protein N7515_003735 [Penicillium bovifimosum]|uniref:Uncharacterized protein n=1 Tax=Penicillium bovifimosum TaxID=126998 RepID=A0A9W9H583_9EURO|nr:uncharacterized protein N7515_003735 [Penicillium bovifimosum]KAJ5138887.1 hypothetical protein N7515_003735 [Penicillium bovifimosum]